MRTNQEKDHQGRKTIKAEPILKTSENDGMIDSISSAADKSRRMSGVLTKIHCKDKAIVNFKKNRFIRMKNPVSRMKRRQRVRRQVRLNAEGSNVFENFGNEVGV